MTLEEAKEKILNLTRDDIDIINKKTKFDEFYENYNFWLNLKNIL